MSNLSNHITQYLVQNPDSSSKEIYEGLASEVSFATLKRALQNLCSERIILRSGNGKSTKYHLSIGYEILHSIDLDTYFLKEIDERNIKKSFNFEIIKQLSNLNLFTSYESELIENLHKEYQTKLTELNNFQKKKELVRLSIDFSWKSAQIEGNTYSLLETERLFLEKETAQGKTKEEAIMLLNHKVALEYLFDNPSVIAPLSVFKIEEIHTLLISDLDINRNIRQGRVAITGTNYNPLDNTYQIREALEEMCTLINETNFVLAKALLSLLLISYIQPFEDGNKRTARIICNAILLGYGYCPISFRTVSPINYKKALLVFYEQNNIFPFKKLFLEQYQFAIKNYF